MPYQTINEYNVTGIEDLFTYTAQIVPIFIPLVLFGFFIIASVASYFTQKKLTGMGNFSASFAVAGWLTAILSTLLSLIPNLVALPVIIMWYAIAFIGVIWLYFSNNLQ